MQAGPLRHSVEIQEARESVDDHHDVVTTWTTVAERRAQVTPEGGRESIQAEQTVGTRRHLVSMRNVPSLSSSHRLIHDGRPLNIEAVIDVKGRGRETQCQCVEDTLEDLQMDQLNGGALTLHALVGRPASTSALLRVVSPIPVETLYEWGTTTDYFTGSTTAAVYRPFTSIDATPSGLTADTLYYYRLNYRRPGVAEWTESTGTFRTARAVGQSFSFGIIADGHMWPAFVARTYDAKTLYQQALANMQGAGLDGVVHLGDAFHAEHYGGWNSPTARDAIRRTMYIAGLWKNYLSSGWLAFVMGNHEGEQLWRHNAGQSLPGYARDARKTVIPNPAAAVVSDLGGALGTDGENCGFFDWGDARFIVLDPYAFTATQPHDRGGIEGSGDNWDWTLSKPQYDWLVSTLAGTSSKWVFVFIHQLVGGVNTYGRGGIEAVAYSVASNGTWEWGGENADGSVGYPTERVGWGDNIHGLLCTALADAKGVFVFMGHDHVGVAQTLDGIYYHHVGQPRDTDYDDGFYGVGQYASGTKILNSHHVQVDVTAASVTVKTMAAVQSGKTPGHGFANNAVMDTYTVNA